VRCILCHKEIHYANKGSHALLAHCKTEMHRKKVIDITTTHSVASLLDSETRASTSATNQCPENIRQQYQTKLPTPTVNRIANAEVGLVVKGTLHPFALSFVSLETQSYFCRADF